MRVFQLGIAALLAGMIVGPGPAQATAQAPRMLILVISPETGWDQIVITFDQKVDHGTLRQKIRELVGGRQSRELRIEDSKFSNILGGESAVQTTAELELKGWVGRPSQPLPLQPFIDAFRDYRRFRLAYQIEGQFEFAGPEDFANPDLEVRLTRQEGSYQYQILVLDPQSPQLQIPVAGEAAGGRSASGKIWAIIIPLLLGLGVAVLAVALAKKRRSSRSA